MGTTWPQYHAVYVTTVPWGLRDHSTMRSMWPQYHGVYVTTVPCGLRDHSIMRSTCLKSSSTHVFIKLSRMLKSHLCIFRKASLTMSHTFGRFCVYRFIIYLCLFPLRAKWTTLDLPSNEDNCLQNVENAVCRNICHVPCSRRRNSLPSGVTNNARTN